MRPIPRDYQELCVTHGLKSLAGDKPQIIVAPTASGKSVIISELCHRLDAPVLIFQPNKEILEQNYNKLASYGIDDIGMFSASMGRKEIEKYTYATIGSVKGRDFSQFGYCLLDECFTGETEILTSRGFVRFDILEEGLPVAQWEDGQISFIRPQRIIREYDGEMTLFHVKNKVTVPMTSGHDQVFETSRGIVKEKIGTAKFHDKKFIIVSGKSGSRIDSGDLSPIERLLIATQADGNIHGTYKNHTTIYFHLSKQRKIDRLLQLLGSSGVDFSEIKSNAADKRKWLVKIPGRITKDITQYLPFPMSYNKARATIEEMVEWDGSKISDTLWYFSSSDKKVTDFYNAVSILAGHSTYQIIQRDCRSDSFNDMHRLTIKLNVERRNTRAMYTSKGSHTGLVYCVTVPSGKIVIRHNGYVFVSGNCHLHNPKAGMYKAFFKKHPKMKVLGLTATPYRMVNKYVWEGGYLNYTSMLQVINRIHPPFFKGYSFRVTNKTLFEKGYLSPIRYITQQDIDISRVKMNTTGADFDAAALEKTMQLPQNVRKLAEAIAEEDLYTPNNLIFCSSIRHAEATGEALGAIGYDSTLIHAQTKNRDKIIADFRSGKIKRLLNVGVLTTGFDFPGLYKVTVGRPILSLGLWYQIVGRVIRLDPENRNKIATVVDVCNNLRRLGSIESIRIGGEVGKEVVESSAGVMSGRPLFTYQINNQQTINRLNG